MGVFKGVRLSVGDLLERSVAFSADDGDQAGSGASVRLVWTAVDAAVKCRELLAAGGSLLDCWRFGVLQSLDAYESLLRLHGVDTAAGVFRMEPPACGAAEIDAALAALAEFLAARDGWDVPAWALVEDRSVGEWFVSGVPAFEEWARQESPVAFARRGIWVTRGGLERV